MGTNKPWYQKPAEGAEAVLSWLSWQYTKRYVKHCRVQKNKVVFSNFLGRGFGDNPKYIAREILRQGLDWELVWLTGSDGGSFPEGIRTVRYGSNRALRELASAGFWVDNVRNSIHPDKKEGQHYLQTWHGGISFKYVEKSVEDKLCDTYLRAAKRDGMLCDAIISACRIQSEDFQENFWLDPRTRILEYGLPRNDALFDQDLLERKYREVRQQLGIPAGTRIILYMPTFRDDLSLEGYQLDFEGIVEAMEARFREPFALVVRLHPNVQSQAGFLTYSEKIVNGTLCPDPQELYMAADYMITDYSSSAFDFSLLNRPVFLCLLDHEKYQKDRGLNQVFDLCPFPKACSNEQLLEMIRSFREEDYWQSFREFREQWQPFDDGQASRRAVEWMKNKIQE